MLRWSWSPPHSIVSLHLQLPFTVSADSWLLSTQRNTKQMCFTSFVLYSDFSVFKLVYIRNELASLAHSFYTSIDQFMHHLYQDYILLIVLFNSIYKTEMMLHSRLYNRLIFLREFLKISHIILLRTARLAAYARTCTSRLIK